jgi:hypothetical protein
VFDWCRTAYSGAKEEIPDLAPKALGKPVITTHYVDANLLHDLSSGKAVTGILHYLNGTLINWYSELQSTVETATFGSEYVAARTCSEQILDLRLTLRYLGVEVKGPAYMFGDNESVVNTASVPHSKLSKRHVALSYHKTRFCIAAGIVRFFHIPGKTNKADIVSKHWDMPSVWESLRSMAFQKYEPTMIDKTTDGETKDDTSDSTSTPSPQDINHRGVEDVRSQSCVTSHVSPGTDRAEGA